jgi:DNA-binding SARP family transcriptional activator
MASMRIESDVNLFYSQATGEFLCAIQEFADRQSSTIKVYSLNAPPVPAAVYLASLRSPKSAHPSPVLVLLLAGLAGAGVLACFLLYRRRKRSPAVTPAGIPAIQTPARETPAAPAPTLASPVAEPVTPESRNVIHLLGGFLVLDRKGNDITHLFSPKIKQLFLLILFHSTEGRGIGSKKISARLWPEKDPAKTKNIKGVTFNHLRNILADIDGIELLFTGDSYSFRIAEPLFCDYWLVWQQLQNGRIEPGRLRLVTRGPLLEDMVDPLVDEFKSDYESRLLTTLLPALQQAYESGDYRTALEIARVLLCMDPFNEEVLKYQLKSYRRLKGIEYSRRAYDQFIQDYQRILGVAYHTSFDKIVQ